MSRIHTEYVDVLLLLYSDDSVDSALLCATTVVEMTHKTEWLTSVQ